MLTPGCHPEIRLHFDLIIEPGWSFVDISPLVINSLHDIDMSQTIYARQRKTHEVDLGNDDSNVTQTLTTTKTSEFRIKKWECKYDIGEGLTGHVYLVQTK